MAASAAGAPGDLSGNINALLSELKKIKYPAEFDVIKCVAAPSLPICRHPAPRHDVSEEQWMNSAGSLAGRGMGTQQRFSPSCTTRSSGSRVMLPASSSPTGTR